MANTNVELSKNRRINIEVIPLLLNHVNSGTVIKMFLELLLHVDSRTNLSVLVPKSKSDENAISTGYKILREGNVIIRVKPRTYLINPEYVAPLPVIKSLVVEQWQAAINKK